jgi:hypothetical protein
MVSTLPDLRPFKRTSILHCFVPDFNYREFAGVKKSCEQTKSILNMKGERKKIPF